MNQLKEIFKKNEIEGVVFDLDTTLINTYDWLMEEYRQLTLDMTDFLATQYNITIDPNLFFETYKQAEGEQYHNGNVNFIKRFRDTLKQTFGILEIDIDIEVIHKKYIEKIASLYKVSPPPYPKTLEVLHNLSFSNIVICTHSGTEWGTLKINDLKEKYYKKYDQPLNIISHTIALDHKKNDKEWIIAAQKIPSSPKKLIAVGDSFTSDILPAAQAGYKYLIWKTMSSKDRLIDIEELDKLGHKTLVIDDIGDITTILTSNQLFEDK